MHDQITFTREEIYDLVWQKPMMRLAEEYAVTDVGLAKLCARHRIPTPPRGYWAKLQAGNPPPRPPLLPCREKSPIRLRAIPQSEEGSRRREGLAAAISEEKDSKNRIVVAERLHAPCTLVREAKEALTAVEPDRVGILRPPPGCLDLRVSRAQLPRVLRVADALLKSFESRGWGVTVRDDGTSVQIGGALIAFYVEEHLETVELPPKPDLGGGYSFHYRSHETERRPSGRLSITIRERHFLYPYSQQRNWHDAEKRVLEEQLNSVIVGILKLATAVHADLENRAQVAKAEEERQRVLEAQLAEQLRLSANIAEERARVSHLVRQAARWRRSQELRGFVEHVVARGRVEELQLEGQALADWAQWALQQADRMDPLMQSPPSIIDDAERVAQMCDELRERR